MNILKASAIQVALLAVLSSGLIGQVVERIYERVTPNGTERIIETALRRNNWNRQLTADQLKINRTTLYKKMERYGLEFGSPAEAHA